MSQTVSEQNLRAVAQFGCIARQRITHLQGPGEIRGAVLEHIAQIFAGVLAAGEVQGDPASLLCGHDAAGEHAGAVVGRLARQTQHAHAGVVVVQHFALRGLPNQFVARRLDELRLVFHNLPLRRGGQWDAQCLFQLFQTIKRHSAAVLEQRDHGGGGLVVFFRADAFRFRRGEHFAAQVAAQTIQLIHGGRQRSLSHDAHQRPRFFLRIDFPFFTARAGIARVQFRMRNRDFLGAGVGGSSVAPVTFCRLWLIFRRGCGGLL